MLGRPVLLLHLCRDPTRGFQPRAGAARLYGKYDNTGKVSTPTFGNDDSLAIRLSAAVQHDYGGMWDASPGYLWEELVRRDDVTWKNLLVALSRHQPRLIALTGFGPGHEVIAYDAWVGPDGNGELKVADPNHPGEFRKIFYQNGAFVLPDEYSADFRWVRDDGVSALCSFKQVATRWQEFSNKTIGNDLFPTYALKYRNGNASTVLTDGMTISQLPNDKLILDLPVTIVNLNKAPAGTTLTVPRTYAEATLKPGLNQVPVLVEAQGAGKGWVDFQWLSINYSQAPVKPHFTSVNYWDNDPTQGIAFTFEYYEQDGNWVLDGKERHFDGPGRLEEETTWVDGKKSGPHREWFLGCLKVFATYYNDKLEGTYWEYPADGREYYYSWVERQYKDGQEVADSAKSYDRSTPVVCNLSIEIRDGVLDETSLTAYTDSLVTVNFFNNDYPTQHTLSFYSDAAYTQPIFLGRSVTHRLRSIAGLPPPISSRPRAQRERTTSGATSIRGRKGRSS